MMNGTQGPMDGHYQVWQYR